MVCAPTLGPLGFQCLLHVLQLRQGRGSLDLLGKSHCGVKHLAGGVEALLGLEGVTAVRYDMDVHSERPRFFSPSFFEESRRVLLMRDLALERSPREARGA